jgi:hypothetical protein
VDLHESSHHGGAEGAPDASEVPPASTGGSPPPQPVRSPSGSEGDEIMTKLPRSRPRRATPRRKPPSTGRTRAAARKPRASGVTRRTAKKPANQGVSGRAGATAPTVTRPRRFPSAEPAPGLPRLALDGAVEAAKLPIKVAAGITFRALDAVARGLRRD